MIRIRSEHAIGYLKGRFQSLKGLRVAICDEQSHKFATYWVLACVVLHNIALECEEEARRRDDSVSEVGTSDNSFIRQELSETSASSLSVSSVEEPDEHMVQYLATVTRGVT